MDLGTTLVLFISVVGFARSQNPEIVNDILPEIQRVGRTARLNCTVARLGKNSVQWSFNGPGNPYAISINQEIQVLNTRIGGLPQYQVKKIVPDANADRTTFQLVIARVRPEFSGTYQCTVAIANVKNFEHWTRKTGKLTVQYSPIIKPGSTDYVKMVEKGADDVIRCDAHGVPSPNITWARSDGALLPNGKALSRGRTLAIKGAGVEYTGVYRCVADNYIKPPAEALVQVYVYQAPSVRVLQDSVGQQATGRYEVKLDCIAQGYPTPAVSWGFYRKDKFEIITNTDKYEATKQVTDMQNLMNGEQWYTLRIRNIQASDFRKYYCVAKNYKGIKNETITLFSTSDCQGPLCYYLAADNKNSAGLSQLSPLVVLLTPLLAIFRS